MKIKLARLLKDEKESKIRQGQLLEEKTNEICNMKKLTKILSTDSVEEIMPIISSNNNLSWKII